MEPSHVALTESRQACAGAAYTDRMSSRAARLAVRVRDQGLLPAWIAIIALWRAAAGDHTEAMWMSREGAAVLADGALKHPDQWGWAPQPWDFIPTSPGWEVLSGALWRSLGTFGFSVLAFFVTAGTLGVLAWVARGLGASRLAIVAALIFTSALASGILTSRAGLPAFALLIGLFMSFWTLRTRFRALSSAKATAAAAAFGFAFGYTGIWLHGSWTLFSVVAAAGLLLLATSVEFGPVRHRFTVAATAGTSAVVATLVGPLGPSVWANTLRVGAECRGLVKEWTSPWSLGSIWPSLWLIMVALLLLGISGDWRRRKHVARDPLRLVMIALALGAVAAGAIAIRFLLLGIVAAAPLLASWLTTFVRSRPVARIRDSLGERGQEPYWRTIAALLAVAVLPFAAIDAAQTPWTANAAISALPRACNLFSDDYDAKAVEFWRPDVRVWVDGRQDYWGRERIVLTNRYVAGLIPGRLLPEGATCVLLQTAEKSQLARSLNDSDAWTRVVRNHELTLWAPAAR